MAVGEARALSDPAARVWPPLVALARFLMWIFFRRVEVVGLENLPKDRPVMVVANHNNSLVDGALLVACLNPVPRFLGKSTLWQISILKPFLKLAAAIPVFRRQDPGVDAAKNAETFSLCHEVLARRGAIAIFPEGTSHSEPALVPLKTGVSRIVLEAEAAYKDLDVAIVPVGLTFEEKERFRSRALVNVGLPVELAGARERYREEPREAVLELTERVRGALEAVTLNFPSWDEARLIERAAEIFDRPTTELPAEQPLHEAFTARQAFTEGYAELLQRCPEEVHRLVEAVQIYDQRLEDLRLEDEQVAANYPASGVLRFVTKSLFLLLLRLPLAALGTVIHFVPFHLASRVARWRVETDDVLSTYKILASMVFYPLTWIALATVGGVYLGWPAGLALLIVSPLSGILALRYHERHGHFLRQARAFLLLKSGRRGVEDLRPLRERVLEGVRELVAVVGEEGRSP